MLSQDLPSTTLMLGVSGQQSNEGTVLRGINEIQRERAIAELQDFIAQRPDSRESRKAFAVKLVYQGYLYDEIQTILEV